MTEDDDVWQLAMHMGHGNIEHATLILEACASSALSTGDSTMSVMRRIHDWRGCCAD